LREQTRDLATAAISAEAAAGRAGKRFRDHTQALSRFADEIAKKAEALREIGAESAQGAFLQTANRIIEGLGGLSIDIARILDTEIPDRDWHQYLKGDRSLFARRVIRLGSRRTRQRIARFYRENSEFHEHVDRFIAQFENLLAKGIECERDNALTVTFLSSSMGKLYVLLARSIGRIK